MVLGSFAELTRQVHLLNDLILSDMVYADQDYTEVAEKFSRHLHATKYWFMRTSFANKKRFVIALLHDLRSGWALSLLLKSIWNCRTKDAVLSFWSHPETLSPYDQIPIDHNRTAQPLRALAQVMTDERGWFHTLDPEAQAMMILELLNIAGGPVMMEALRRAQLIYEYNRDMQLQNLLECIVVDEPPKPKDQVLTSDKIETKRDQSPTKPKSTGATGSGSGEDGQPSVKAPHAQRDLEANLAVWNSVIKTIRDSQKLEEFEMTFKDGTKRKIWKVNRPKPEATETVDFLQLLPATIGKRILSLLPKQTLGEYARVNKYWAYLVEDMHVEWVARNKLNSDLEKLQEMMLKHDTSMDMIAEAPVVAVGPASVGTSSISSSKGGARKATPSSRKSDKSTAYSFRHYLDEKMKTGVRIKPKAIQNLAELQERLDRRGAAEENLWQWCRYIIKMTKIDKDPRPDGLLRFENRRFPTPLMKFNLQLPLAHIVKKDPAIAFAVFPKSRKNIAEASMDLQKEPNVKRFSLWSRDFSSLYKVYKVASYQSPV